MSSTDRAFMIITLLAGVLVWDDDARARQTPFEQSDGQRTPSYEETMAWLADLSAESPLIELTSFGTSPQGRSLPLVIADQEGRFTAVTPDVRQDRVVLMVQACIHAGESCGKDAGMLLLRDLAESPVLAAELLDKVTASAIAYLNAQVAAGAQALMIFDTWGGVLSPRDYRNFSLAYMERIVRGLVREHQGRRVPVILFTKGGGQWAEAIAATGCDGIGLDWTVDLGDVRRRTGDRIALQGNLDPSTLYASPERIREGVARVLASYGHGSGHVFNLGHGITPDVDPEHAGAMVEAVHELSRQYHS